MNLVNLYSKISLSKILNKIKILTINTNLETFVCRTSVACVQNTIFTFQIFCLSNRINAIIDELDERKHFGKFYFSSVSFFISFVNGNSNFFNYYFQ